MDQKFTDQLYENLLIELSALKEDTHYSSALAAISFTMGELKQHVVMEGFSDENSEIVFFKHIKPMFYAQFIYRVEEHNFLNGLPPGPTEVIRGYLMEELSFIKRFFDSACLSLPILFVEGGY